MQRLHSFQLSVLTAALCAGAMGCNDDASDRGESGALALIDDSGVAEAGDAGSLDGADAATVSMDGGLDGGAVRPDPSGIYFAEVVANGSGCPSGTWLSSISADGKSFSVTTESFEVLINNQTIDPVVSKECTLSLRVHSPTGVSFALQSFQFAGTTFLEQGVTARIRARYWFQGNPIPPSTSNREELVGPQDREWLFRDDIRAADQVWSPCGTDRDLNINTVIQLVNSDPKRSGYVYVQKLPYDDVIKLGVRPCTPPASPTVAPGKGLH